jgi:hypothetical protein
VEKEDRRQDRRGRIGRRCRPGARLILGSGATGPDASCGHRAGRQDIDGPAQANDLYRGRRCALSGA